VNSLNAIRLVMTLISVTAAFVLAGCTEAEHEADLNEFLQAYDPALKSKRDELLSTIESTRIKRNELDALTTKYRSEAAKANLQAQIRQIDTQINQLEAALSSLDEKIELAMVSRDIDRSDAGGLRNLEAEDLLESTSRAINQAKTLQQNFDQDLAASNFSKLNNSSADKVEPLQGDGPSSLHPKTPEKAPKDLDQDLAVSNSSKLDKPSTLKAVPLQVDKSSSLHPKSPEPASKDFDRPTLERQLRKIDAAISINEANLKKAWDTIHSLTNHGSKPIEKYSRDHSIYLSARRIRIDCEARLPVLKAQKKEIETLLNSEPK
jgi:hypothetical protein